MHVHGCLLALHTGKPVKMVYNREESFFGHVHRHPATMRYEHGADPRRQARLRPRQIHLDGGAYASSAPRRSSATPARWASVPTSSRTSTWTATAPTPTTRRAARCAASARCRPRSRSRRRWTSSPTRSASTRSSSGSATAMEEGDRSTDRAGHRQRGAGGRAARAAAGDAAAARAHARQPTRPAPTCPGGVANTTHGEGVRRGVGYAVAYKNVAFSEGFDDYSTARVRLEVVGAGRRTRPCTPRPPRSARGWSPSSSRSAAPSSASTRVVVHPKNTQVGSGGLDLGLAADLRHRRSGPGRLRGVRGSVLDRAAARTGHGRSTALRLERRRGRRRPAQSRSSLADLLGDDAVEETVEWRHRPTHPIDPETGQGFAHVQYAFAAHRAVVDVDVELGLVKVVELACTQDVGKAINPDAVVGQIQGGSTQGMGLALMEEIQIVDGKIRNPSFTDYLIPTILDTPPMPIEVLEYADPHAPYGLRGVGEAPTISSGPAVAAAIRAATGLDLRRVPVRPEDVTGTR